MLENVPADLWLITNVAYLPRGLWLLSFSFDATIGNIYTVQVRGNDFLL